MANLHKASELAEEVAEALKDPSSEIRIEALRVLERLQDVSTVDALIKFFEQTNNFAFAAKAASILSGFPAAVRKGIAPRFEKIIQQQAAPARQIQILVAGAYFFAEDRAEYALSLARKAHD